MTTQIMKQDHETTQFPPTIDSAPKDGTTILVWNDSRKQWEKAFWDEDEWCGAHHSSTHGNPIMNATHWLSQPPHPQDKEAWSKNV